MTSDLTFITNEKGESLLNRFSALIKETRCFDCLVGYFYSRGFYPLYKSLDKTENIRILIGISTNKETFDLIQKSRYENQQPLQLSHKETKDAFSNQVVSEMETSEDSFEVEEGVEKFKEWLKSGKLKIHVYPAETIHAKLYIMTFKKDHIDAGRVITGSSNFSMAGLRDNIEFNVELKNRSDYEFALKKFNELWDNSVDVSEEYVATIKEKTWLNDSITPYELYLKFLYEYLKEKINLDKEELFKEYIPENFMDLEYQKDAVTDAKMKLEEYGGVFISDVVGLGKTYISAMLAHVVPINVNQDSFNLVKRIFGVSQRLSIIFSISEGLRIPAKIESKEKQDFEIVKQYQFSKYTNISEGSYISKEKLKSVISEKSVRYKKIIQEKILIAEDALEINATIDIKQRIPQGGVYFGTMLLPNLDIKYILSLLNSRLFSCIYEVLYSGMHMGGGYLRYRSKFLENLPIVEKVLISTKNDQKSLIELVDIIFNITNSPDYLDSPEKQAHVKTVEKEIDQLVYKLYALTPEEINIVDGFDKKE